MDLHRRLLNQRFFLWQEHRLCLLDPLLQHRFLVAAVSASVGFTPTFSTYSFSKEDRLYGELVHTTNRDVEHSVGREEKERYINISILHHLKKSLFLYSS